MACSNCNSPYIQNKKYNLCGECVFRKTHGGRSKVEVYQERVEKKINTLKRKDSSRIKFLDKKTNTTIIHSTSSEVKSHIYVQDEVSRQNEINQNLAELEARRDAKARGEEFDLNDYEESRLINVVKSSPNSSKKKGKSIKQVSEKQLPIERAYRLTCIDMDHTTEPLCTGCGRYQGGDVRLSHSHLISRADCKRIGRPELIYERRNLTYHCIDFGMNKGCHSRWENPIERSLLLDYEENIKTVEELAPGILIKYKSKDA